MAFSFGNPSNAAMGSPSSSAGLNIQTAPDLEEIQTEALGFLSLAGESRVQLLSSPWPSDSLPQPTASLMSVASHKGLVAAAGPDAVIVATTESVRKAFEGPKPEDSHFRPFQPQLTLPMPMRISQLAFSSDETYLVLSAAEGGGLAVYEVQALLQGSTQPAFQVPTNGQALRALIPNPKAERGELIAAVTNDGNLMMANLKEKNFISGPNGQVLKDGVSCISWSTQGKQLVAGLGNGTVFQMKPDGTGTGEIPAPPNIGAGHHVSSITWLENHVFLLAHTPSNFDSSTAPESIFHVATRQPPSTFMFQKIADPAPPFGLNRSPPHHFLLRLKDFPPNLQDLIIVASTASADIGIFSRAKAPLTGDKPADKITGVFTMTGMADDSRRAQMPMAGDLSDTSPVGVALDLSSREKVARPIPRDDMDESPTPIPALMVLNNEGVLSSWWIIYSDSIRQGTTYPGLVVAEGSAQPAQTTPALGQPTQSPFGAPTTQPAISQPAFGASSNPSTAFGSTSKLGAFGAPSGLGKTQSPWGTSSSGTNQNNTPSFGSSAFGSTTTPTPAATNAPAFGSPAFGTPATSSAPSGGGAFGAPSFGATSTPSFGNSGLPGSRPSPWGSAAAGSSSSAFGQPSGLGKSASVFGTPSASTTGTAAPSSGGFASFAQKGGFAAAAAPSTTGSIFASKPASPSPTTNIFGAKAESPAPGTSSLFGAPKPATSIFGAPSGSGTSFGGTSTVGTSEKSGGLFGNNNFVLGSTFKADPSAKDDNEKPSDGAGKSLFGGGFSSALGEVAKPPPAPAPESKDADMDGDNNIDVSKPEVTTKVDSTTPVSTPAPPKFTSSTPGASLFGTSETPAAKPFGSAAFSFGKPSGGDENSKSVFEQSNSSVPKDSFSAAENTSAKPSSASPVSRVKEEPASDEEHDGISKDIPEAPLPPDPTSKASYGAGDTPESSIGADAPLPPDFMPKAQKQEQFSSPDTKKSDTAAISSDLIPPSDVPGGPEESDDSEDFLTEDDDENGPSGEEEGSEEGSGEDVTKDLSPPSAGTPGFTPQSSFGGLANHSPAGSVFTSVQRPQQPNSGRSLFGEINASAPVLPPPKQLTSPRSPSPIRTVASRLQRPEQSRSVSAPGAASQLLGSKAKPLQSKTSSQTLAFAIEQQKAEDERRAALRAKKEAEESQALIDDEDEMIQKFLASEITPTKDLDEFVAHADYVSGASAESIPAQIETVYRDINSMIDTLGINARALKSFITGHTDRYKYGHVHRTREDLENEQDWVLIEIEELGPLVEGAVTHQLEEGKVHDVTAKLEACEDLEKDLSRLRAKHEDIKKIWGSHTDPDHLAIVRAQPLSAEQAAQQHDLRKQFMTFQELLAKAEEELTVLKAALASHSGRSHGKAGPTVEAVLKTISKMTNMAEKRSGDIDLLENQMRRLRFSSAASSRDGSPFATPQKKASLRNPGSSSAYGLFYTPDSVKDTSRNLQNSLMSSTSSFARSSSPRKKLSGFSVEEKADLRMKLARKKQVTDRLRAALHKSGTNVRLMDDDE